MKMFHAATDEESNDSPLRRGKGRQALGWVCRLAHEPTPALRDRCRCAPPLQGGDLGRGPRLSRVEMKNRRPPKARSALHDSC